MAAVNYKMADFNGEVLKKKIVGGEWGVRSQEWQNTLKVFPPRRPLLGLQLLTGSNGGFGPVNHFLGVPELPEPDGWPSQRVRRIRLQPAEASPR